MEGKLDVIMKKKIIDLWKWPLKLPNLTKLASAASDKVKLFYTENMSCGISNEPAQRGEYKNGV